MSEFKDFEKYKMRNVSFRNDMPLTREEGGERWGVFYARPTLRTGYPPQMNFLIITQRSEFILKNLFWWATNQLKTHFFGRGKKIPFSLTRAINGIK